MKSVYKIGGMPVAIRGSKAAWARSHSHYRTLCASEAGKASGICWICRENLRTYSQHARSNYRAWRYGITEMNEAGQPTLKLPSHSGESSTCISSTDTTGPKFGFHNS